MRGISADRAGIRFHRAEIKTASRKDSRIGVIHIAIAQIQALFIPIEGIGILHDELPAAHQSETRPRLIPVFRLDLIEIDRQLTV